MPDTFCTQTDQTELAAAERDIPPHKKSELESGAEADTGPHAQFVVTYAKQSYYFCFLTKIYLISEPHLTLD